jgi:hypothetical protein
VEIKDVSAAMAKLATGIVPHFMPFFRSTTCATVAASSCLTHVHARLSHPHCQSFGHGRLHGQRAEATPAIVDKPP